MRYRKPLLAVAVVFALVAPMQADKRLKGIACRSVHLRYPGKEAVSFYNEINVQHSAPGTYFAVCGWDRGYYGIQELGNGKKLLIFSVWDSGRKSADPKDDGRARLIYKAKEVRARRFGGEGTGGQSFFDYDWKNETTYRFLVTAKVKGERTEYSGLFYLPEKKKWKRLITFSTLTGGKLLRGYYSFVEDFKRDRVSTIKQRMATFGPGWLRDSRGDAIPLKEAQFTADSNPVLNIDAWRSGTGFRLATGGKTKNEHTKLGAKLHLPANGIKAPSDLPQP